MVTKQPSLNARWANDGSEFVTLTDGFGNLAGLYPAGALPVTASATGTTGVVTATLPGVAGHTTYVSGFTIGANATTAVSGNATLTGIVTGTASFLQGVAASPAVATMTQTFNPAIPANAVNTAIVINSIAAGTAGNTTVTIWGYQQ